MVEPDGLPLPAHAPVPYDDKKRRHFASPWALSSAPDIMGARRGGQWQIGAKSVAAGRKLELLFLLAGSFPQQAENLLRFSAMQWPIRPYLPHQGRRR
ncbi:hypothetical protein ACFP8Z_11590 [Gemmobacter lanyuensis]|uniref:hypothetical protein n=1 Tax=Gemmobacter lanyuensis TaxID=1054497 RepID=UPI00167A109B|nr:hypothetical protein [Gemmobacter lanyuensis]